MSERIIYRANGIVISECDDLDSQPRMVKLHMYGQLLRMYRSDFIDMLKGCQSVLDEQAAEENAKLIRNGP